MLKTVTIDIDVEDFLDDVETEDLIGALNSREDYSNEDQWETLYALLCQRRDAEAVLIMKKMVSERTGRIIP